MKDFRIEDFLGLVADVARDIVFRNPDLDHFHDDLIGAGHLKLVELRDREDLNPYTIRAYVRTAVRRAMLDELSLYLPESDPMDEGWVDPDSEDLEDYLLAKVDLERYIENKREDK